MNGIQRWMVIVVVSMLALLTVFGFILWRLGIFDFTGDDPTAKIIAATLALIGGLIGSIVTIVGMFLKHSLDQQAEKRLKVESDRNAEMRKQEQERLKLDTAIQAINLLSTSSGKDAPPTQMAGVLFTLTNLGQEALAINLASQMVENNQIDAKTVDWLIDRALKSEDETTRDEACSLLDNIACTVFVQEREGKVVMHRLPYCLSEWNPKLSEEVIRRGLYTLVNQILSQPRSYWPETTISYFIACLASHWQGVEEPTMKNSIGICLEKFLDFEKIPERVQPTTIPGTAMDIHSIKQEVHGLSERIRVIPHWTGYRILSEKIEEWAST